MKIVKLWIIFMSSSLRGLYKINHIYFRGFLIKILCVIKKLRTQSFRLESYRDLEITLREDFGV